MGKHVVLTRDIQLKPEQLIGVPTLGGLLILKEVIASWWNRPDVEDIFTDNVHHLADISFTELLELTALLSPIIDEDDAATLYQAIRLDDPNVTYSVEIS